MVEFEFNTAWSPPYAWFEAAVRHHPALRFELLWNEEQALWGRFTGTEGISEAFEPELEEFLELWPDCPYQPWDEDEDDDEVGP